MSKDKEREAFEAWWHDHYHAGHIHADSHGIYHSIEVQAAWEAWRDRAALATQPPAVQGEPVAYIHRQGRHWEVSERFLTDDEKARGWTEEPLYTASTPSREVEPLTDEALGSAMTNSYYDAASFIAGVRFAERAHGIHSRGEGEKA